MIGRFLKNPIWIFRPNRISRCIFILSYVFVIIYILFHINEIFKSSTYKENYQPKRIESKINLEKLLNFFPKYPLICRNKIKTLINIWQKDACFFYYSVNGSFESILRYLTEVEKFCPNIYNLNTKLQWIDNHPNMHILIDKNFPNNFIQNNINTLDYFLSKIDNNYVLNFTRKRITSLWLEWEKAFFSFHSQRAQLLHKKKVVFIIGIFIAESKLNFVRDSSSGGPLGELVQWSDLIISAFLIGYDVKIIHELDQLLFFFGKNAKSSCPSTKMNFFDEIYIDYLALNIMHNHFGFIYFEESLNCKLRIIDSFGTEPQFLSKKYEHDIYQGYGTHPRQIYTMFPHTPDNTFIGFSIDDPPLDSDVINKQNIALVYGKNIDFWKKPFIKEYLKIFKDQGFDIHVTVSSDDKNYIPDFAINHGVLNHEDLKKLLMKSKIFIGFGFPYEGPAPLEAISFGCVYINPIFNPLIGPHNTDFFRGKPTTRNISSQNQYMEQFVGEPYVYSIEIDSVIKNSDLIHKKLKELKSFHFKPYLPYEFTKLGLLVRFSHFSENSDYCSLNQNPLSKLNNVVDIRKLKIFLVGFNESCWHSCQKKNMVCENLFLEQINDFAISNYLQCKRPSKINNSYIDYAHDFRSVVVTYASPQISDKACLLERNPKSFSCGSIPLQNFKRICPCRVFDSVITAY